MINSLKSIGRVASLAAFSLCVASSPLLAQTPNADPPKSTDNSKTNLPGNHADANRADQQSDTPANREITRKIRKSITDDKSLSTYAHNVKIITTKDGFVTLKGPVRSESEKDAVNAKAVEVAGASNVKNLITVKSE